jgi:hypothetical protein
VRRYCLILATWPARWLPNPVMIGHVLTGVIGAANGS